MTDTTTALTAEVVAEIRKLQAMLDEATDGDLLCEDICLLVCAGPCHGAPFGGGHP